MRTRWSPYSTPYGVTDLRPSVFTGTWDSHLSFIMSLRFCYLYIGLTCFKFVSSKLPILSADLTCGFPANTGSAIRFFWPLAGKPHLYKRTSTVYKWNPSRLYAWAKPRPVIQIMGLTFSSKFDKGSIRLRNPFTDNLVVVTGTLDSHLYFIILENSLITF